MKFTFALIVLATFSIHLIAKEKAIESIYGFDVVAMNGKTVPMSDFKNKVLLIVNTASRCGFTSQLEGLKALYKQYKDQDFVVLGFPTNQFGNQDPGSNKEIATFCRVNYGVTFPMFRKIEVNGNEASPLFQFLKRNQPGLFGVKRIHWNFTKFLVDKEGRVVDRFAPVTKPKKLSGKIEALIAQ